MKTLLIALAALLLLPARDAAANDLIKRAVAKAPREHRRWVARQAAKIVKMDEVTIGPHLLSGKNANGVKRDLNFLPGDLGSFTTISVGGKRSVERSTGPDPWGKPGVLWTSETRRVGKNLTASARAKGLEPGNVVLNEVWTRNKTVVRREPQFIIGK